MALNLNTQLTVLSDRLTVSGAVSESARYALNRVKTWTDGTGADSASKSYQVSGTLAGSAVDYDLTSLTGSISFAKVRVFAVVAGAANVGDLTVGGGTNPWTAAWSGTFPVPPGGCRYMEAPKAAGFAVTNGSSDVLRINGTSGDTYELFLAGE